MIIRTGLGQALACPPGTTDPSCAATVQYKEASYQPSADLLRIQKAGLDVSPDAATAVIDPRQAFGQAGASASAIAWGLAAVAVVLVVMMSMGGGRR